MAAELAALSVLEAAELSVLEAALLSVLELAAAVSVLELAAESVEEEESAEEVLEDEDESAEDVDDPDWLFPPVGVRVHDLVSRTRGSPLSPVMGSRVIVHFWIIGPVALVAKGSNLRRHLRGKSSSTHVWRVCVTCTVVDCDRFSPSLATLSAECVRFSGIAGAAFA